MYLLQCSTFLSARFQFYLYTSHLSGAANTLANDLSHHKAADAFSFLTHPGKSLSHSHPRGIIGHSSYIQVRLDLTTLDQTVDQYFLQGLAPSTQHTYTSEHTHEHNL